MIRALILTCGNPLRGDDGIGLQIAHSMAVGICDPDTEIYSQQQWTPELAEAISRADLVIFVDASVAVAPGKVRAQPISPDSSATDSGMTHTCSPSRPARPRAAALWKNAGSQLPGHDWRTIVRTFRLAF